MVNYQRVHSHQVDCKQYIGRLRHCAARSAEKSAMARLVDTLDALGLYGEIALSGRWVKIQGEQCAIYLVESVWGTSYLTWCDAPCDRTVHLYHDPIKAIEAALRCAANVGQS